MARSPKSLKIRSYNVGFGDCFLLSFAYGLQQERHVLIDFGSTGLPEGAPKSRMMDIAQDIKERTGGTLDAVVATHRHKDHISGFETKKNRKGTGDVIRALKPKIVIQPWTEDPDLATKATGPKLKKFGAATPRHIAALSGMHRVAEQALLAVRRSRDLPQAVRHQLSFLGENNIKNASAVKNLMTMAKNVYVHAESKSGMEKVLPGVKIHVLGPPTVDQHERVKKQAHEHPDEFWFYQAGALDFANAAKGGAPALFPRHVRSRGPNFPVDTRWLIYHARTMRGEQLLQIVRMLDKAMNNTSVVLLFEVGGKRLLFPGDAQIENWEYALGKDKFTRLLKTTNLYKVGHHGSLNATPKSLWGLFGKRSKDKTSTKRLISLMSTMEGMHGHAESGTEVPRETLVSALKRETRHFSTQELEGGEAFFSDTEVKFT